MVLHISVCEIIINYSFLLLSSIPLDGKTTICFVMFLLIDIIFQLLTIQIKLLNTFRYRFLISLVIFSIFSSIFFCHLYIIFGEASGQIFFNWIILLLSWKGSLHGLDTYPLSDTYFANNFPWAMSVFSFLLWCLLKSNTFKFQWAPSSSFFHYSVRSTPNLRNNNQIQSYQDSSPMSSFRNFIF